MPASSTDENRRKRLRYQCWHRGTKEMDLILGRFSDSGLALLDARGLTALEQLLDEDDRLIFEWLLGRQAPPPRIDADLLDRLRVCLSDTLQSVHQDPPAS